MSIAPDSRYAASDRKVVVGTRQEVDALADYLSARKASVESKTAVGGTLNRSDKDWLRQFLSGAAVSRNPDIWSTSSKVVMTIFDGKVFPSESDAPRGRQPIIYRVHKNNHVEYALIAIEAISRAISVGLTFFGEFSSMIRNIHGSNSTA